MDIIDALVKRLIEDDDLLKGVTPRKVQRLLEHIRNAKNQSLSPEQRKMALENAIEIARTGKEKKAPSSRSSQMSALTEKLSAAKQKSSAAADKKLAEIAARAGIKHEPEKEKEKPATPLARDPNLGPTRTEIEASAKRAARDPNAMPKKYFEAVKPFEEAVTETYMKQPEKAKRMVRAKASSQVKDALDEIGKMYGRDDIAGAHELYHAIPKELLPKHLHDYDPAYMHYGMTPGAWGAPEVGQDFKNAIHAHHRNVISGQLDNDPVHKDTVAKVKALQTPKPQS